MTWQLAFYGLIYKRLQRNRGFPCKPWDVVPVITATLRAVIGLCPCCLYSDYKDPNISNNNLENPIWIQLMQHWCKVQGVNWAEWVSNTGAGNVQTSDLPNKLHFKSQPGLCSSAGGCAALLQHLSSAHSASAQWLHSLSFTWWEYLFIEEIVQYRDIKYAPVFWLSSLGFTGKEWIFQLIGFSRV